MLVSTALEKHRRDANEVRIWASNLRRAWTQPDHHQCALRRSPVRTAQATARSACKLRRRNVDTLERLSTFSAFSPINSSVDGCTLPATRLNIPFPDRQSASPSIPQPELGLAAAGYIEGVGSLRPMRCECSCAARSIRRCSDAPGPGRRRRP